jgi:hypothetical protein
VSLFDKRTLTAWLLSVPLSYFTVAYFENFYPSPVEVALWTILIHALSALWTHYLIGKSLAKFRSASADGWIAAFLYAGLLVFIPAMYGMAKPFRNLFDAAVFHLASGSWAWYAAAVLAAYPLFLWLLSTARKKQWKNSRLFRFADNNLDGLLIAFLFFAVYLIFASIFNRPSYDADDIFFDADGNLYRWRFATEKYRDYYWRPAHPYILIIIRPLVNLLAFVFRGDTLFAAFTLNALIGALCVYLVWFFVRHSVGNSLYALLIASLFGATSTQLAFAAIIESYIYLSVIALVFFALLLTDKPFYMQALAGLLAFGVTITNVAQTFIAHFFIKRNFKQIVLYGVVIAALVVPLSLLNNWVYPEAHPYFWDLSTLDSEGHNQFPPTVQRASLMARVITLHSFVSPQPLVIKDGFPFRKVWMFRASIKKDPMRIATYESPLGNGLARVWAGLTLLGGTLFLKNIFKQDNRYSLAFLFTVLFFFGLHLQYGKDVFLYSANWTYAITLFLALAWRELAGKRWFQAVLLVFTLLLLVNNSQMLRTMLVISAPSVHSPVWR